MRTTLSIDDDIMTTAKGLAARERKTIGEIISSLARQGLRPRPSAAVATRRNGLLLLPVRPDALPVTPELIALLGDEMP